MRLLTALLMIFLLSHNAEGRARARHFHIEGFEAYVSLFKEQAKLHNRKLYMDDLIIRFKKIPQDKKAKDTVLALCYMPQSLDDIPTIDVDPKEWKEAGPIRRMILLFHEMGHCVLLRDHEDDYSSIMNSYLLAPTAYAVNEWVYIDELFHADKYRHNKKKPKPQSKPGDIDEW